MQLNCRSCRAPIAAEDVNIQMAIAKCGSCNAVFSFANQMEAPQRKAALAERPKIGTPKGFTVDNYGTDFVITRSWFSFGVIPLLFFCIVWDGFLVFWYGIAFSTKEIQWIMVLFPMLHLAVGVGLSYFVLCSFVNRTRIKISMGELTVRHGPLPWPGNYSLSAHDVEQIYCQSKFHRSKHGGRYSYEVQAIKKDGSKQTLITGLTDPDQAIFIEQQLEDHLRIEDRRVPGEMDY